MFRTDVLGGSWFQATAYVTVLKFHGVLIALADDDN